MDTTSGFVIFVIIVLCVLFIGSLGGTDSKTQRLKKRGIRVRAKLTSITTTSGIAKGSKKYIVTARWQSPETKKWYTFKATRIVRPKLSLGDAVYVVVDLSSPIVYRMEL